jgi:hypothetical protein
MYVKSHHGDASAIEESSEMFVEMKKKELRIRIRIVI